jgi:hypothetical protein
MSSAEKILDNLGVLIKPSREDGNLAAIKAKTDNLDVILSTRATEATLAAISAKLNPIGVHANAWNAAVVTSGTNSPAVDVQYNDVVSVFGNVSANMNSLRLQASQDGINFYTAATVSISTGNFGTTLQWGARYIRLQAGGNATITATIAAK